MRKAAICVLALVMVCVAGCATGQSYVNPNYDFSKLESVAVVDIEGALRSKAAKDQIATYFEMELLKRGYRVVERNRVEAILAEQDFQASDVTRPEGAVKAGRILNVGRANGREYPQFRRRDKHDCEDPQRRRRGNPVDRRGNGGNWPHAGNNSRRNGRCRRWHSSRRQ